MPDQSISNFALLRVMVLKEVRTTFRERSQMLGLVVAVIMLFVIVTASLLPALAALRMRNGVVFPTTGPATTQSIAVIAPPRPPMRQTTQIRLASVVMESMIGFFFSCGYLFAAVLATFVGEKEAKTLEILLASPLSDRKLYIVKCVSVLLPSAVLGFAFAAGVSALLIVLIPDNLIEHSSQLAIVSTLLCVPVMAMLQLWFVGIGAAISARTETMKGAGQVLGVVLLVLIFGTVYGIPLAASLVPSVIPPTLALLRQLARSGFVLQYIGVLFLLAIPAGTFIAVGRWSFRRDRMLS